MMAFQSTWGNYLLKAFVETTAPPAISWWPQTIGWKFLLLGLFLFTIKKMYGLWQAYQRNAYRREALVWINALTTFYDLEQQAIYRQLPALLRKTALVAFDRSKICQLQSDEWDAWLDQHCQSTAFTKRCARQLHLLSFAPASQISPQQIQTLLNEIRLWIKFHRRPND